MTYVQPHLISSHAQLISAPHPSVRREQQPESDYKVTGTSIFERPDKDSQWDPGNGGRWIRKWLPGEKEAEAQQRIGDVKNEQAMEILGLKHAQNRDFAEQRSRLGTLAEADRLKMLLPPNPAPPPKPAVQTLFPTDQSELATQGIFKNVMSAVQKMFSGAAQPVGPKSGGPVDVRFYSELNRGRPEAQQTQPPQTSADGLSALYESGGSVFGNRGESAADRPLLRLGAPDMDIASAGGDLPTWKNYSSLLGGMMDMFLINV